MEGLHQAEYSFPTPDELINSVPEKNETESERIQREADRLLDEKAQAVGEWWLDDFFFNVVNELQNLDVAKNYQEPYDINIVNNKREFVDNREAFRIDFNMTHKNSFKEEVWNTKISISFWDEIEITYSSGVEWYNQISEASITLLSPLDIQEVLNSLIILTPEISA